MPNRNYDYYYDDCLIKDGDDDHDDEDYVIC